MGFIDGSEFRLSAFKNGIDRRLCIAVAGITLVAAGCQGLTRSDTGLFSQVSGSGNKPAEGSPKLSGPKVAELHMSLARAFEAQGNTERAIAEYKQAVDADRKCALAHWRLGVLRDTQGQFEQADKHYQEAAKLQPKNADLWADVGYSYYLSRRWADAERAFRKSLELNPDHARAHNNLGLTLAAQERYEEALAEFGKAGSSAEAQCNLAFALTIQQKHEEARRAYELALNESPGLPAASAGLARSAPRPHVSLSAPLQLIGHAEAATP